MGMTKDREKSSVAIKRCKNLFEDDIDCKRILREISILAKLDHENVVKLLDVCAPENKDTFDEVYMVMELADSDLKKLMKQDVNLEILHIQTVFFHLLRGVTYIHSR